MSGEHALCEEYFCCCDGFTVAVKSLETHLRQGNTYHSYVPRQLKDLLAAGMTMAEAKQHVEQRKQCQQAAQLMLSHYESVGKTLLELLYRLQEALGTLKQKRERKLATVTEAFQSKVKSVLAQPSHSLPDLSFPELDVSVLVRTTIEKVVIDISVLVTDFCREQNVQLDHPEEIWKKVLDTVPKKRKRSAGDAQKPTKKREKARGDCEPGAI